ncbi:MAG: hypothetical protein AAF959_08645 [Cyanobacteria bacterium P01_D01_bin.56]
MLCLDRWQGLCQRLGVTNNIEQEFTRLVAAYGEPHRAYHTAQHIGECLALLDSLGELLTLQQLSVLELALWYHDMVYQPNARNNEQRSADEAVAFLNDVTIAEWVQALIMATRHSTEPDGGLTNWIVDIDLAILGAAPDRFLQYEHQIRQEYAWLSAEVYGHKRRQAMTQFLERPRLYCSMLFFERFEHQARQNLAWLLLESPLSS